MSRLFHILGRSIGHTVRLFPVGFVKSYNNYFVNYSYIFIFYSIIFFGRATVHIAYHYKTIVGDTYLTNADVVVVWRLQTLNLDIVYSTNHART